MVGKSRSTRCRAQPEMPAHESAYAGSRAIAYRPGEHGSPSSSGSGWSCTWTRRIPRLLVLVLEAFPVFLRQPRRTSCCENRCYTSKRITNSHHSFHCQLYSRRHQKVDSSSALVQREGLFFACSASLWASSHVLCRTSAMLPLRSTFVSD